jgi:8-oxo-dGTP diphosphatase
MRVAINAAIIQDRKILVVRKGQSWILPGGKPNPDESDLECVCREVDEELSGTQLQNIRYYNQFEGISPHKGDRINVIVYLADIKGQLFQPSAEINACEWVGYTNDKTLSDITNKIIESLRKDRYL